MVAAMEAFTAQACASSPRTAHEPSGPKLFEVGAGKLHADVGLLRQCLHTLLALTQQFDKFQPLRSRQGFADAANLLVEAIFDYSHDGITV